MMVKLSSIQRVAVTGFIALIIAILVVAPVMAATILPIYKLSWGTSGTGTGQFASPAAVEAYISNPLDAATMRVYVADTNNSRIQIFNGTGEFQSAFGPTFTNGATQDALFRPGGITVDSSGNIYVADTYNHRILKFTSAGVFVAQATASGLGSFVLPGGLAVNSTANLLYVADTGNNRVAVLNSADLTSAGTTAMGSTLSGPKDVALNKEGTFLFVADTNKNRIVKIDTTTGLETATFGSVGSGTNQFSNPSGIAVDPDGNIFVADTSNNRIHKVPSTLSGEARLATISADPATFSGPMGLAVAGIDVLYMADTGNHRMLYFEPNLAPTDITLSGTYHFPETNATDVVIGTAAGVDSNENDTFTYAFTSMSGKTCSNSTNFLINKDSGIITTKTLFDFETPASYGVCIKATDSGGQSTTKAFPLTLDDGPDAPSLDPTTASFTLKEYTTLTTNTTKVGTEVKTIKIIDNDVIDDMVEFKIVGGSFANVFNVEKTGERTAKLVIKDDGQTPPSYQTLLDYETALAHQGTVEIEVKDTDTAPRTPGSPNVSVVTVTINLDPVDEAPSIILPETSFSVDENTAKNIQIGDLITVTDPDTPGSNHALSVDTAYPDLRFAFARTTYSGNTSTWKMTTTSTLISFEDGSPVLLHVRSGKGGIYTYTTIPVTVINVNEAPVIKTDYAIAEHASVGTRLNLAVDQDGDPIMYTIVSGNTGDTFEVDGSGNIQVANSTLLDLTQWVTQPPHFYLGITAYDGINMAVAGTVPITVGISNRLPVLADATLSVREDAGLGVEVGRISATDEDNDELTFGMTTTGSPFTVSTSADHTQAVVSLADPSMLNYEATTSYTLNITVDDGSGVLVARDYVVNVTNVNEQLTIDEPKVTTFTLGDITSRGQAFTTITWSDPDNHGAVVVHPTFNSTGDTDFFTVNADGVVSVKPDADLHYYQKSTYNLYVVVDDGGLPSDPNNTTSAYIHLTINLTDDNDAPTFKPAAPALSVVENATNGTVLVNKFQVFDENGDDFDVALSGTNAFSIQLDGTATANGIITKTYTVTVTDTTKLDYDTVQGHVLSLQLTGTDKRSPAASRNYSYNINLTNVNEQPLLADQTFGTYEYTNGGILVDTILASDPDAETALTFASACAAGANCGSGEGIFQILANGEIRVINGKSGDIKATSSPFILYAKVTDSGEPPLTSRTAQITINVTPKADLRVETFTVPFPEMFVSSPYYYSIKVSNNGDGKSSAYDLSLTLPTGLQIEFDQNTTDANCQMINLDTLDCPDRPALSPKGTPGDTKIYTFNATVVKGVRGNAPITTTAVLDLADVFNDLDSVNNSKTVDVTIRTSTITVTNQNFNSGEPQGFSSGALAVTPNCGKAATQPKQTFLGLFNNQILTFTKALPKHEKLEISFDLYIVNSWDGNYLPAGPDRWKLCLGACQTPADSNYLLDTTFSNNPDPSSLLLQAFPDNYGLGEHPGQYRASASNTLGYSADGSCNANTRTEDSVYSLKYTLADHTDPSIILKFIGDNLEGGEFQEKWGIDNFKIVIFGGGANDTFLPFIRR